MTACFNSLVSGAVHHNNDTSEEEMDQWQYEILNNGA